MWNLLKATLIIQLASLVLVIFPIFSEPKPIVDPGLFMILGVESCRNGSGYCLLGLDCTLDDDFLPDDTGGHCNGLKKAFTPSAHFTCCKENPTPPVTTSPKRKKPIPPELTTEKPISHLEASNSTAVTDFDQFETLPTTSEEQQTTDLTTTDAVVILSTEKNIYIDVSNQVFHEVTAPVLIETTTI